MGIIKNQKILNTEKIKTKTDLTDTHRAILSEFILFSGLTNMFNNIPYVFPAALPVMGLRLISDILINKLY